MRAILLILLAAACGPGDRPTVATRWTTYDPNFYPYAFAVDPAGDIYTAGDQSDQQDVWIAKRKHENGETAWTIHVTAVPGAGTVWMPHLGTDHANNVLVTGIASGHVDFGGAILTSSGGAIVAIDDIAIGGNHDRRALLEAALDSGHCLVLDAGDGIQGFVVTVPRVFFGRDFVELLMVDRTRRRAGIGRRLLQAAVSSASTSRVFTSANRSNSPMRALLGREGWSLSGELLGLDEGDPEIVYFIDRAVR